MRYITRKIFPFLVIGLISMLVANRSIYLHTHELPNGKLVTHAHPYQKSSDSGPVKTHTHPLGIFLILDNLDVLFLSVAFSLLFLNQQTKRKHSEAQLALTNSKLTDNKRGRAPPLAFFS